jgi:hypothetical protein
VIPCWLDKKGLGFRGQERVVLGLGFLGVSGFRDYGVRGQEVWGPGLSGLVLKGERFWDWESASRVTSLHDRR